MKPTNVLNYVENLVYNRHLSLCGSEWAKEDISIMRTGFHSVPEDLLTSFLLVQSKRLSHACQTPMSRDRNAHFIGWEGLESWTGTTLGPENQELTTSPPARWTRPLLSTGQSRAPAMVQAPWPSLRAALCSHRFASISFLLVTTLILILIVQSLMRDTK